MGMEKHRKVLNEQRNITMQVERMEKESCKREEGGNQIQSEIEFALNLPRSKKYLEIKFKS